MDSVYFFKKNYGMTKCSKLKKHVVNFVIPAQAGIHTGKKRILQTKQKNKIKT
ncbi:hypothetical protein OMAG_000494 [Candidatus Omnitrophus magneticus]|uniref:Uncharacterized protein n=1 Tax=Candidatus Omnitrophus magneticus TaxID=1609969 RepID=A0A0F0CW07_9BACT|nr:hypothetical protein OMAG_000494 [Candidatus Omnitrophus magneticus]